MTAPPDTTPRTGAVPPEEIKAVPVRHPWRWVSVAVLGVLIALMLPFTFLIFPAHGNAPLQRIPWYDLVLFAATFAAAVLTLVAGRWLPSAAGGGAAVARWMAIAAVALFAAAFAQRLLGRLLPIAALFDLDIGFPGDAPTRLRIASLARPRRQHTASYDRVPAASQRNQAPREDQTASQRNQALRRLQTGADGDVRAAAEHVLAGYVASVRPGLVTRPHLARVRALAVPVAMRLGSSAADTDRLQWALLLREFRATRPDERGPDRALVAWLGPYAALTQGPFTDVAHHPSSVAAARAAHAAAVADAYLVVGVAHPDRRVTSGYAGGRLKALGDPRLLPEAIDALLTLPPARRRQHQHGSNEGHLPPVQENVTVVGRAEVTNPSGAGNDGRVADVFAHGDYAYLNAFRDPTCVDAGGEGGHQCSGTNNATIVPQK